MLGSIGKAIGGLFKGSTSQTSVKNPYEQNPWGPQQDYLKSGFNMAQTAANNAMAGQPNFTTSITDMTADMTGGQDKALQGLIANGQNTASGAGMLSEAGMGLFGGLQDSQNNARDLYASAGQDKTQAIIGNAQQYADNPALQGVIDSSLNDVRTAFDGTVGRINSAASGTGNINSTRAGALEARALDDAMDRSADISSGLRFNAYNDGLNRSQSQMQQDTANQFQANASLGSTGAIGADVFSQGSGLQSGALSDVLNAETQYQTQNQNEIQGKAQLEQLQRELAVQGITLPQEVVQRYMASIGGSYGGKGFNTQTNFQENPSAMQTIAGLASTAKGLFS